MNKTTPVHFPGRARRGIALVLALALGLLLAACQAAPASPAPTGTATAAAPATAAATATAPPTSTSSPTPSPTATATRTPRPTPTPTPLHPLAIEAMRQQAYPGSPVTIEQTLEAGVNYQRYIASYRSEGLKIYALLTVPDGPPPETGWPVILFNHGYIPPDQYRTTERYVAYVDAFARNGYIVFRSDYRGHGDSEGEATGAYATPAYTVDILHAIAAMQNYPDADPNRIGMWGHSMGGTITLRAMVVSKAIRAGVIWAGVVAPYPDLVTRCCRGANVTPPAGATPNPRTVWRDEMLARYGTPEDNPAFWASISPNSYLADLSGPLQLHHGTADESVPYEFSEDLYAQVLAAGMPVEFYTYPGDNHNLSVNLGLALQRSVEFFDRYVKGP